MTMVSLVEKPVDRQDGGDHVERHVVAEEREERQRDEQVVDRRDDRADAEAELEAERQVEQDANSENPVASSALLRSS
jgi:hypothetical protein